MEVKRIEEKECGESPQTPQAESKQEELVTTYYDSSLYSRLLDYFRAHVYIPDNRRHHLLACYALMCKRYTQFDVLPYLDVKGSTNTGKSQLIDTMVALFGSKAITSATATPAVLFHYINDEEPELVAIDEADLISKDAIADTCSILNAGYQKNRYAPRCEKGENDHYKVKKFKTFCPKMWAGIILKFPRQTENRAIPIVMIQAPKYAKINFHFDHELAERLQKELEDYKQRHQNDKISKPYKPEEWGSNRIAKLFFPLFQVAPTREAEEMLHSLCFELAQEQAQADASETWQGFIIQTIATMIGRQMALEDQGMIKINAPELLGTIKQNLPNDNQQFKWHMPRLGRELRALAFKHEHTRQGNYWTITQQLFQELLTRYGEQTEAPIPQNL
ncbi:MAG TPA: hypothetical protein VMU35_03025 [Methylomirabilota bacterium]|nr:hypothetical protein [Methylomirabilota bacterium]